MNLHQTESITDVAKNLSLPATTLGLNVYGVSLPDIVQILTGVYLVFLVIDKVYTLHLKHKYREMDRRESTK